MLLLKYIVSALFLHRGTDLVQLCRLEESDRDVAWQYAYIIDLGTNKKTSSFSL